MINVKAALWAAEEGELTQTVGRSLTPKLSGCGHRGHQGWGLMKYKTTGGQGQPRNTDQQRSQVKGGETPAEGFGAQRGEGSETFHLYPPFQG